MKIHFSTGLIVVTVAIVIFYIRVAILRGRKKRYEREYALKRRKVNGRSKGAALPSNPPGSPPFGVTSWLLVVVSCLIALAGIIMYNNMSLFGMNLISSQAVIEKYSQFWYIPVAIGVILLAFCIKIEKPRIDDGK